MTKCDSCHLVVTLLSFFIHPSVQDRKGGGMEQKSRQEVLQLLKVPVQGNVCAKSQIRRAKIQSEVTALSVLHEKTG